MSAERGNMSIKEIIPLAAVAALLGGLGMVRARGERSASESSEITVMEAAETCCFRNPAYTGTCEVVPTEDETCASILTYLNNPMAEGKSYCGGTSVRQGWTQVSCEEREARTLPR